MRHKNFGGGRLFRMTWFVLALMFLCSLSSAETTGLVCEFRPVAASGQFGADIIAKASTGLKKGIAGSSCPDEMISFAVSGKASFPGVFEMCRPVNVITAVLAAGGPAADGSMRKLTVHHGKTLLGEFNLYDFVKSGRLPGDFMLNGGEVIKIEPAGSRITVSGRIANPAVYELLDSELNLPVAIKIAGGFSADSGAFHIEILRKVDFRQTLVADYDVLPGHAVPDFQLQNGDMVNITLCIASDNQFVSIEGQAEEKKVKFSRGMRVSDALINHVRFKNGAALEYAEILREGGADMTYIVHGFSPSDVLSGNPDSDIALQPGDRIMFFPESFLNREAVVVISGKVRKPSKYTLKNNATVAELIKNSGGILPAVPGRLDLTRRRIVDGRLEMTLVEINAYRALSGDPAHNLPLQPFDLLHIH